MILRAVLGRVDGEDAEEGACSWVKALLNTGRGSNVVAILMAGSGEVEVRREIAGRSHRSSSELTPRSRDHHFPIC